MKNPSSRIKKKPSSFGANVTTFSQASSSPASRSTAANMAPSLRQSALHYPGVARANAVGFAAKREALRLDGRFGVIACRHGRSRRGLPQQEALNHDAGRMSLSFFDLVLDL